MPSEPLSVSIQQTFELALGHHRAGRLREAEQLYRQVLIHQPDHVDGTLYLGILASQMRQHDAAIALFRRAILLRPGLAQAHHNLGNALRDQGKLQEAFESYRRAIGLKPDFPEPYCNLGNILLGNGQLQDAIDIFQAAIAIRPDSAEVLCNLGYALKEAGRFSDAIAACRQSIALSPFNPEAYTNLGSALQANDQIEQAIAAHQQAIALRPSYAQAHNNLGSALTDAGEFDEALVQFSKAVQLRPDLPEAHHDLALALLSHGDFERGWEEYQWRWKCRSFSTPSRIFAQPQWDGAPFRDRTLLLYAEQGLGDAIQFVRYLPMVAEQGGQIVLECPPLMGQVFQSLVQTIKADCAIVSQGDALPRFDLHCPLLSLPLIFKTMLSTIPSRQPYLFPDPQRINSWRKRLESSGRDLKVGLVWAGSPRFKRDRYRSLSLDRLAPLTDVPRVTFYSLQKGPAASQAKFPPPGMKLIDWTDEFILFNNDALIASLDLIISVDTAVAHLAGALGRPTWVLLPFAADWRWMLHRTDSPWYPTMRLFRQTTRCDWDSVVDRVAQALRLLAQNHH